MKRIVVPGAKGMLGHTVVKYFRLGGHEVRPLSRAEFDIAADDMNKLEPYLEGADAVVNCAGIIRQKIADYAVEEVLKVNAIFPRNLARLCARRGVPCIHVTTDCAFSGRRGGYTESDYCDAGDVYGMSKAAGETDACMTLRTSIIGEEAPGGRSLLSWVLSRRGKTVNGYADHYWNGVTTLCLAGVIRAVLEEDLYAPGLYHIHSPDVVSKYELVSLINEVYGLGISVNEYRTGTPCDRSLKSEKALSGRLCRKGLREQVRELKAFFEG